VRTYGFLIGELVRRIDGRTLGRFFREEIAEPFGIDYYIGLPESEFGRCAEFIPESRGTIYDSKIDQSSYLARASPQLSAELYNSPQWRKAELPASNGHGNARSLARFYALLANGGELDGRRLLSEQSVRHATAVQHRIHECVMDRTYNQCLGFLRTSLPIVWMGPVEEAFGHQGAGGALGFGDPVNRLGFGYLMNRMHARRENGPRARRLIEALYQSVGAIP
jgi:CubicO group peptidase (beta-lactamase class C family)